MAAAEQILKRLLTGVAQLATITKVATVTPADQGHPGAPSPIDVGKPIARATGRLRGELVSVTGAKTQPVVQAEQLGTFLVHSLDVFYCAGDNLMASTITKQCRHSSLDVTTRRHCFACGTLCTLGIFHSLER